MAACALPRHPLAETYGDTMGYRRPPRAQTVAPMSQGQRVLVLAVSVNVLNPIRGAGGKNKIFDLVESL